MSDILWIRADIPDSKEDRRLAAADAVAAGIKSVIVRPEDTDFAELGAENVLYVSYSGRKGDTLVANIKTLRDLRRVLSRTGSFRAVVLEETDNSVIPLENIIAVFSGSGIRVLVEVSDADRAKVCINALEVGADGLVIRNPLQAAEISELTKPPQTIPLSEVRVTETKITEAGDRSCIDTISVMNPSEGMLIGSQSSCLFLVASESENNDFINSRPFRVNAGAVHSYVLVPDGMTRYISEISAGDSALIVSKEGTSRKTTVGRSKTERRPLIMIKASDGKNDYNVILQYAETVKLIGPKGNIPVTSLKEGDVVLAHLSSAGRHCGIPVDESVIEK
jgi:3-dehydroquinate synthase II